MISKDEHELGWDRLALPGPIAMPGWQVGVWRLVPVLVALTLHGAITLTSLKIRPDDLGAPDGTKDALAVELMDSATFDERYKSVVAGKPEAAKPVPAAADTPQPTVSNPVQSSIPEHTTKLLEHTEPATPRRQSAPQLPGESLPAFDEHLTASKPQLDLSAPPSTLAAQLKPRSLTASELVNKQLGGSARERAGEIDAYNTMIARGLEQTKPVSNGLKGQLVVAFTLSPLGKLQDLHLVTSSGKRELDNLVLAALTGLQFRIPPIGADQRDRSYEITYDYK